MGCLCACTRSPPTQSASASATAPSARAACSDRPRGLPQRLLLLSPAQLANVVRDLLGPDAVPDDALPDPRTAELLFDEDARVNATVLDDATRLVETALSAVEARIPELPACTNTALTDKCVSRFATSFASRAFRRPVEPVELESLMSVFRTARTLGARAGLRALMQAILLAPSTLYRTELGASGSESGETTLNSYELASALSFLITDSAPDAALRAAADSGLLTTDDGIIAEVDRMLATPGAQRRLTRALLANHGVGKVLTSTKQGTAFPTWSSALGESLYRGTELFVDDVLWRSRARLDALLTSPRAFVDEASAAHYSVPYPSDGVGFVPVELADTERAGLLTQASILAARASPETTSVVSRGLFVRGSLLCLPKVRSPPEALRDEIIEQANSQRSEREKAEARAARAECASCHAQLDRFGLLLESFDAIGRFRPQSDRPADSTVDLTGLAGGFAGNVGGAVAFARIAAESDAYWTCLVRSMVSLALARFFDDLDDCGFNEVKRVFLASDRRATDLVRAVATSRLLRVRGRTQERP
jgi:hypothetical protein